MFERRSFHVLRRPRSVAPESEILAANERAHVAFCKDRAQKFFLLRALERVVESRRKREIRAEAFKKADALFEHVDLPALFAAVKGHHADFQIFFRRAVHRGVQQGAVTDVHSVEITEHEHARLFHPLRGIVVDNFQHNFVLARMTPPPASATP